MRPGWILCLCLLTWACASTPPAPPTTTAQRPDDFPAAMCREAAAQGKPVYQVDPQASRLTVLVGRTGTLARLGHDHVLSNSQIGGAALIAEDPAQAMADIYLAPASFEVDPPALRTQSGLPGQLTADEIAQTREHMLNDVLSVEHDPWVKVHATWAADAPERTVLIAAVTMHGITRPARVPVTYAYDARRLRVSGEFQIRQSDFGLTPYSLLGGTLAVQDALHLSFHIEATRGG